MTVSEAITGKVFGKHNCTGHPESQDRLDIAVQGVPKEVLIREPVAAKVYDLTRVHDENYLYAVEERVTDCLPGRCCYLDPDTYITTFSFDAALVAAGSSMLAVDRALEGVHCFALVRPPGHHAGADYAKGFCIFNNVAVAAAYALERCDKVAIVDWDVHHGNGTQDIFYDSERVLYCSLHQSYCFPGTGWPDETGILAGKGYTLNVPLPTGSMMREYRIAYEKRIVPGLLSFSPDLIIISAGQDTLFDDPLGGMNLVPADFGEMTKIVSACSPGALALVLEGGYGPSHGDAVAQIFQSL
jgi:acetoin utilization deacetylase AcuC-like enzyme